MRRIVHEAPNKKKYTTKYTQQYTQQYTPTNHKHSAPPPPVACSHQCTERKRIWSQPLAHHGIQPRHCFLKVASLGSGADERVEGDCIWSCPGASGGVVAMHDAKGFVGAVSLERRRWCGTT
jgi:hypothetical protein